MDVGQHVDPPDRLPAVVAEVDPTRHKDAGIGTEEVDRTDTRFRLLDDARDIARNYYWLCEEAEILEEKTDGE